MSATLNRVILLGNVGKDIEIKRTRDGKEMIYFPLATSDVWKDKETGERKQRTEWHRIMIVVPQLVDVCKNYVKKGMKLYIEGSLQTRRWSDRDNANVEKYITEIWVQYNGGTLLLLHNKHENADGTANVNHKNEDNRASASDYTKKASSSYQIEDIDEDKIPF